MTHYMLRKLITRSLLAIVAAAVGLTSVQSSDAQEWARSMFEKFQHDFGQVNKGTLPEYRFKITNKFEEDIRIRSVYSSCGCTTATLSKNLLKSWETAELVCRFNTPVFDGFKQATVTVAFDHPFSAEVQLNVRGTIVRQTGLQVSPREVNFGQAASGKLPMQPIELVRSGDPSFELIDIKSTYKHIGIRPVLTARNNQVVSYRLEARVKESAPKGLNSGELFLVVRDQGRIMEIPVKFNGSIVSPLQVTPQILTLSNVNQGQEVKRKVIVKADKPFHIKDVTSQNLNFRVRADKNAFKKVHFVDVIYTGDDTPGQHENELNFETDLSTKTIGSMKAIVEIVEGSEQDEE